MAVEAQQWRWSGRAHNGGDVLTCQSTSHKALSPVWLVLVARKSQKSFTIHVIGKEVDCLQEASMLCEFVE